MNFALSGSTVPRLGETRQLTVTARDAATGTPIERAALIATPMGDPNAQGAILALTHSGSATATYTFAAMQTEFVLDNTKFEPWRKVVNALPPPDRFLKPTILQLPRVTAFARSGPGGEAGS
jgi:hypothetical protein